MGVSHINLIMGFLTCKPRMLQCLAHGPIAYGMKYKLKFVNPTDFNLRHATYLQLITFAL